ncbi:hypothetical protein ABE38_20870 [Brevibacillus agri]|nr:hypothetical protein [Brevibacillus agri]
MSFSGAKIISGSKGANDDGHRGNPADVLCQLARETGYPIVDAAMKQLNETGWMHNRLRMIAAAGNGAPPPGRTRSRTSAFSIRFRKGKNSIRTEPLSKNIFPFCGKSLYNISISLGRCLSMCRKKRDAG